MNHVAIDLGSRNSQICIRSADGKVQLEKKVSTQLLKNLFQELQQKQQPSRVVLETSSEAFTVADLAKTAGHKVTVVPATLAPTLGVGQRGVKTDRKDAQNLSMVSCRMEDLPSVHVPSQQARDRRAMLTSRAALITTRTRLINSVRGWARTQLLHIPTGKKSTFPKRARDAALAQPHGLPSYIERLLQALDGINEQIASADKELEKLCEQDSTCVLLMTMPGVGPVTSMSYRAAIDDHERFKSIHAVGSYLGLTPGENSSGMKVNRLGITSAGPKRLRASLVQAAWTAYRTSPNDPMVQWAKELAQKKPVQVAIVALARKMSGILFAMWRDGKAYDPQHQHQQ